MRKTWKNKKSAQTPLKVRGTEKKVQKTKPLTAQEIQDEIFKRMSASKKIKLTSDLTMFCLKLNELNKRKRAAGAAFTNGQSSPGA